MSRPAAAGSFPCPAPARAPGFPPSPPTAASSRTHGRWRDLNIWRQSLAGDTEPEPLIRSTRLDHLPRYSPDGRRIAFISDRTGSMQLWVADNDGTNALQLTSYEGRVGHPAKLVRR